MLNVLKQIGLVLLVTIVTVMPGVAYTDKSGDVLLMVATSLGAGVAAIFLGVIAIAATRAQRTVPVVIATAIGGGATSALFFAVG